MDYVTLQPYIQDGLIGLFIILFGMIKIPKIEINLWSFLAQKLGTAMNHEVLDQMKKLTSDFESHVKQEEEEKARAARYRILRCESELRRSNNVGIYSKEGFDELLRDIDRYNKFCNEHPDFENAKAVLAIDYILDEYAEYMRDNRFLA